MVPLLIIFLLEGAMFLAFLTFVIAGVTDAFDGFLARVLRQKTELGAFIDPVADKLLLISSYVTMAVLELIPSWLSVLVVSRDTIILTGIAILMLSDKKVNIQPTLDSKITTFFQLTTICYFLGKDTILLPAILGDALLMMTAVITGFSGLHYIAIGFSILAGDETDKNTTNQKDKKKT